MLSIYLPVKQEPTTFTGSYTIGESYAHSFATSVIVKSKFVEIFYFTRKIYY